MLLRIVSAFVLVVYALSCSSADESSSESVESSESIQSLSEQPLLPSFTGNIPPNHVRIVGTIVEINENLTSTDPSDPCSRAPCIATVRIDSVKGYGAAFAGVLTLGNRIEMRFPFTLGDTKEIIPGMIDYYPGLSLGSQFLADVESRQVFDPGARSTIEYIIFGYEIK